MKFFIMDQLMSNEVAPLAAVTIWAEDDAAAAVRDGDVRTHGNFVAFRRRVGR